MIRSIRYFTPYFLYVLAYLAFTKTGFYSWGPLVYLFFLIPLVELLIKPDAENLTEDQEAEAKSNPIFDYILWLTVLLQLGALYLFLISMDFSAPFLDSAGRVPPLHVIFRSLF